MNERRLGAADIQKLDETLGDMELPENLSLIAADDYDGSEDGDDSKLKDEMP